MPEPLLSPSVAAFIQSGLSITLAARDDRLVPSIAKAVGCRVDDDRRAVTILVFADAAEEVCRDVARNGLIAVTFSLPSTNETVQIKGRDARCVPVMPQDIAHARRHVDLFAAELQPLGWDPPYIDAVFWRDPADLMAIRFTPDEAFAQTPGPSAGQALCAKE